ncbi:MAG: nitroreductase [Flavobacteriaceae bacterium]|nr:nitroreductase [Flavobacteriaceae bacterium]
MISEKELSYIIKNRRSIYPNQYIEEDISDDSLKKIFDNANMAPTHRLTQPWRFKVVRGENRLKLAEILSSIHLSNNPKGKINRTKVLKIKEKCISSSVILIICMQRDPKESVPEWEEVAATAMAVQNIWLTSFTMGIGCYWSSPASINELGNYINFKKGERCLGLMYMGYYDSKEKILYKRDLIDYKIDWSPNLEID